MNNYTTTELAGLAKQIHENAKAKGFWGENPNMGEKLMLIISEAGEALEAHRKDKWADVSGLALVMKGQEHLPMHMREYDSVYFEQAFQSCIKDSVEDEVADVFIRLLDLAEYWQNNLEKCGRQILEIIQSDVELSADMISSNFGQGLYDLCRRLCEWRFHGGHLYEAIVFVIAFADYHKIDLRFHVEAKMRYNKSRPYKHDKAY